ncbi:hypothetical protein DdX_05417 [Ditylenchus destructor]|uniref:Uncharacterized protein n=1 Tax=Ditylenchus destructor TaxID=166010 RepID=A0AAD4N655_9BILA|nr:hypothetical protein DdX_05417 [Ditylenchus destructor]
MEHYSIIPRALREEKVARYSKAKADDFLKNTMISGAANCLEWTWLICDTVTALCSIVGPQVKDGLCNMLPATGKDKKKADLDADYCLT